MPMFQALVANMNTSFHPENVSKLAAQVSTFAPGKPLDLSFAAEPDSALQKLWNRWVKTMPPAIQETLRGVIHTALSASPPRLVTFAWAPAYDFEVTVWDAPCGITVLIKGRYPADPEPNRGDPKA
jgi:hypothetical protein